MEALRTLACESFMFDGTTTELTRAMFTSVNENLFFAKGVKFVSAENGDSRVN